MVSVSRTISRKRLILQAARVQRGHDLLHLCEGMIVVHDVRTDAGVLLLPGGARLTRTSATRLSQILGPRTFLDVCPAA